MTSYSNTGFTNGLLATSFASFTRRLTPDRLRHPVALGHLRHPIVAHGPQCLLDLEVELHRILDRLRTRPMRKRLIKRLKHCLILRANPDPDRRPRIIPSHTTGHTRRLQEPTENGATV